MKTGAQPSRRVFLGSALALPYILGGTDRRPNILYALADDWMWPHASIYGDPVVKTPTFDRVASRGVLFSNAFVTAPSCTPSRASMLTGQWHWRLERGANLSGTLSAKFPTYPDLLGAAGYHVGFMRKGWGPGKLTDSGRTNNPAGPHFQDFASFLAERPKGQPFCFWFGSVDPHRPYEWESGVNSGMRLEDVRVPPYLPDCEAIRKDICDYYWKVQRYDRETGELLAMLQETGELDNTIVVMAGDNGWPFPRCKATVYETGTHTPLVISWPDRIKPGRVVDDFVSHADLAPTFLEVAGLTPSAQVTARSLLPVLLSDKSGYVDPRRDHVLTGMERHVPCRGASKGGYPMRAIRTREFHYIRNFTPDRWAAGDPGAEPYTYEQLATDTRVAFADVDAGPSKAYMVLHRDDPEVKPLFERAFGKRPAQELYDLRSDPWQMRNVADDPQYATARKRLDGQLTAELKATGDPRITGQGAVFETD